MLRGVKQLSALGDDVYDSISPDFFFFAGIASLRARTVPAELRDISPEISSRDVFERKTSAAAFRPRLECAVELRMSACPQSDLMIVRQKCSAHAPLDSGQDYVQARRRRRHPLPRPT